MTLPEKTLCHSYGVCRDVGCHNCPNQKPKTTLAAGANWPTVTPPKLRVKRQPKEKPNNDTLDYFKETHDFLAPLVKPKGTKQLVMVYRDGDGKIVGAEEVKLVNQAVITGTNPFAGTKAHDFCAGFRAAERVYGIGTRKDKTK